MEDLFEQVGAAVPDTEIVSPYSAEGARQVSDDGTIAYAQVDLAERDSNEFTDAGTTVREIVSDAEADLPRDTQVELGGDTADASPPSAPGRRAGPPPGSAARRNRGRRGRRGQVSRRRDARSGSA
jgi:RND superfamily putative drug exporter